ncbi:GUN4 domain-containing protein [Nostoc sp.]|uniref:GUN4 domain-containing protein n=1 Tax=Nostoc sp. TaxID=1180 RepID=UPI002FF4DDEB
MMNHPQQPREFDAVLGDQSPVLEGAAVLGGIEGVKLRLINPDPKVKIAALEQALNYGEQGLDLLIQTLNDNNLEIQNAAYLLLRYRTETRVKKALIESDIEILKQGSTDYIRLRDFLVVGKWEEADKETDRLMLVVANREKEGWLNVESIDKFPCQDLRTIDQLWVKYSKGRFGFSVQNRIYQSLKNKSDQNIWEVFGDKVGWRRGGKWLYYTEITFDKTAPEAHLPMIIGVYLAGASNCGEWLSLLKVVSSFTSRLVKCNI